MNIVAIIQARMSSTRLPGKVLLSIAGKAMITYVIERARLAKSLNQVIVATSIDSTDDPIVEFCRLNQFAYFRGNLTDVLERYYETAKHLNAQVIVRITSDCPLIDGALIDQGILAFRNDRIDYLSNTIQRTFPRGFDFEIFTFNVLETAYKKATEKPEREHVTPYIWRNHPEDFRIRHFVQETNKSSYRVTVDTAEDFGMIKILIEKFHADKKTCQEIITLLDTHPEIVAINKHIEQKQYGK